MANQNPIQTVLEAERAAREQIDLARQDADAAVGAARRQAKQLLQRNEGRTQQALAAYEARVTEVTETEADSLRAEATAELKQAEERVDALFEELVDETFTAFWPGDSKPGEKDAQ